jgi:hypothetical protein
LQIELEEGTRAGYRLRCDHCPLVDAIKRAIREDKIVQARGPFFTDEHGELATNDNALHAVGGHLRHLTAVANLEGLLADLYGLIAAHTCFGYVDATIVTDRYAAWVIEAASQDLAARRGGLRIGAEGTGTRHRHSRCKEHYRRHASRDALSPGSLYNHYCFLHVVICLLPKLTQTGDNRCSASKSAPAVYVVAVCFGSASL